MSYSEKLIEAYLPESYSPKVGISGSAKEEAKKIYKKAAELGYRDADAFHTAWDEDLGREGVFDLEDSSGDLVEIFNDDGELKQKWHYALYKVLPATPAIKALKQFWAHTYATEPTKWPPYKPQALKSKAKYLASGGKLADISSSTSTVDSPSKPDVKKSEELPAPKIEWGPLLTKVQEALSDKYNSILVDLTETGVRLYHPEFADYKFKYEYYSPRDVDKEYVGDVFVVVEETSKDITLRGGWNILDFRFSIDSPSDMRYSSTHRRIHTDSHTSYIDIAFSRIPVNIDRVFGPTDPVSYDILMDWITPIVDKSIDEAKKQLADRRSVESIISKVESIVGDHKTAAYRFYRVNNRKLVYIPNPEYLRRMPFERACKEYVYGHKPWNISELKPISLSLSDSIQPVISIYHSDDSGRCYSCTTDAISYNSNLLRPNEAAAFGVLDSVDAYNTNKSRKGYFGSKYEELDAYPGNNLFDNLPGYDSWIDSKIEHDSSD